MLRGIWICVSPEHAVFGPSLRRFCLTVLCRNEMVTVITHHMLLQPVCNFHCITKVRNFWDHAVVSHATDERSRGERMNEG